MAYSHCTVTGLGQVQGMGPGAMDPNILYRNVHTGPRQGRNQDPLSPIVLVRCTCPGPILVQCERTWFCANGIEGPSTLYFSVKILLTKRLD